MHAKVQAFSLQKAGNDPSEYEDAFWPLKPLDQNPCSIRLAIGDGATETSFSALWAKLLVREYGTGQLTPGSLSDRVFRLQKLWRRILRERPLPWYAEEKLRDGAFSSLLGLTIGADSAFQVSGGIWEAFAVGDSCLFQARGDDLITRFPIERPEQFDNRPVLVSSVPAANKLLDDAVRMERGLWVIGDVFYLMTDALACWFLRTCELGDRNLLHSLRELQAGPDFEGLIEEQRTISADDARPTLRNDDVTLVRCSMIDP
jgi:hypothetical protein